MVVVIVVIVDGCSYFRTETHIHRNSSTSLLVRTYPLTSLNSLSVASVTEVHLPIYGLVTWLLLEYR